MKFSIGYNYDIKLLAILEKYKQHIEALYFPMPKNYIGSGRYIVQNKNYPNQIPTLIAKCKSLGITSQLLLNSTCQGKESVDRDYFETIVGYVKQLKSLGLKSVVVVNPLYIRGIKKQVKGIRIESSVNCYVKTIEHAIYLKNMGVDVITIDRDINHNISLIKGIKEKTGLKLRIMLNEGCLCNCPYRNLHYNCISHGISDYNNTLNGSYGDNFCFNIFEQDPTKIFNLPFIGPEEAKKYTGFVDYYKLTTRVFSTTKIEYCLKAYISQKYNGNLLDILDSTGLSYFEFVDYSLLKKDNLSKTLSKRNPKCDDGDYYRKLFKKSVILNPEYLKGKPRKKENERIISTYKRIIKKSDYKEPLYLKLAKAYCDLGEYEKGIDAVQKSIDLSKDEPEPYLFLALIYEHQNKLEKALGIYNEAASLFPDFSMIYVNIARTYFNLKKHKEAIKPANKALGLGGEIDYAKVFILLGLCYQHLSQYPKARLQFKKAEKIDPKDSQINFLIYECYKGMGQTDKANKEFAKISEKSKKFS